MLSYARRGARAHRRFWASTAVPPFGRNWAADVHQDPTLAELSSVATPRRQAAERKLLGALALLRNPGELDGQGLGRAVIAAAREGLDDEAWWEAIATRTKQLADTIALHDAALILNGMARSRRLERSLVEALLPRICSHMVYLTSAHLAMLSSAVAKADVHSPRFVNLLTRELKARLIEFHSSMEVTMVINAVSKLRVTDESLYMRLVYHIQSHIGPEAFHVRDISVILASLARAQCTEARMIGRFADYAVQTLPQASSLELARLMHACMSVPGVTDDLFAACVFRNRELTKTLGPSDLVAAAFAFGQCFEVASLNQLTYLRKILKHIKLGSVASLPIFMPRDIASLLRTYARWQITFEDAHLLQIASRMVALRQQFAIEDLAESLYSLTLLMQRNAFRSTSPASAAGMGKSFGDVTQRLFHPIWESLHRGNTAQLEASTVFRAVGASVALRPADRSPVRALVECLARRSLAMEGPACAGLYELLLQLGCSPDDDVMLLLDAGSRARPGRPLLCGTSLGPGARDGI